MYCAIAPVTMTSSYLVLGQMRVMVPAQRGVSEPAWMSSASCSQLRPGISRRRTDKDGEACSAARALLEMVAPPLTLLDGEGQRY